MKTRSHKQANHGFSLSLVLVFTGVLFLLLTGLLAWTTTNGNMTQRYNEYYDTVAAAEAATEKVVASMASDFQNSGVNGVDANLASYGASVPTSGEVSDWGNYEFDDPSGVPNGTYVTKLTAWQYSDLNWKYSGFKGSNSTYRIISNARDIASRYGITSAKTLLVGTGDVSSFTRVADGALKQGNAVQLYPTNDTSIFIRYYRDSTDKRLKRVTNGATNAVVMANAVTNSVVFTGEDSLGNILTNNQNNLVVGVTLQFSQLGGTNMPVSPTNYYKSYQLTTRIVHRPR